MRQIYRWGFLIAASVVVLGIAGPNLLAHFYLNAGFVNLSQAELAVSGQIAVARRQRAEWWFGQATRYVETFQAAKRGLGFSLLARGDKAGAFAAWQEAQIPASILLDFGENMLKLRQGDKALIWYECAAQVDLALSADALAGLLYARKDYVAAIQVWQQALDSFPEYPQRLSWWQGLTSSLRAKGQWIDALSAYKTATSEFPDDPSLLTGMGMALYYSGEDLEVATEVIQRSIALDGSLAESYAALAQIMAQEKQYQQAYAWYSEAVTRDPSVKYWHLARGNMARAAGELSLALGSYRQGTELYPDHSPFYYEISWAYYLNEEQGPAVAAIEQALELVREPDLGYYLRAGRIYEWVGRLDEALAVYQQALELAPDNQHVKDALQRLEGK